MFGCRDVAIAPEWGRRSAGPNLCNRITLAFTSTCSDSDSPSHHSSNSSVTSTDHSTKGIYLLWNTLSTGRRAQPLVDYELSGGAPLRYSRVRVSDPQFSLSRWPIPICPFFARGLWFT